MEHDSLEFRTAEPSTPRILSPELEYDVSVIGIFLGAILGVALFLNNFARGTGVMKTVASAAATISAAARGVAPTLQAAAAGKDPRAGTAGATTTETPPSPLSSTVTSTTSSSANFVFQSTERT